ncbi:alcohol dehydrogenase catalytic domain-containing protein [Marisediminicola sp. LYQ134]|uniref:alcohol dehydrogenase catalytic domain-containing protein n=1 Tax=unclassified Marisediminicola TaxID=2618316 RepID=UPI00398330EB
MKALTWQSTNTVQVDEVTDPFIQHPKDVIIKVTSTAICGSDLHLYGVLGPFLNKGDILGHEPMGVVVEVGSEVSKLAVGDRVVIPFVIACGHCFMCKRGLTTQCETTQNRDTETGASLYGFTELYGSVPGGQAEFLRVPLADFNAVKVQSDLPDDRYLFLSDILPTAWQGVQYANLQPGNTLGVMGLGPVGQFVSRIGAYLGHRVIAVDPVPERRAMAERHGVETMDLTDETLAQLRDLTDGRGPDSVVDAVGLEAHGNHAASFAQKAVGLLPDAIAKKAMDTAGIDRLSALMMSIEAVSRGGTVSMSGVYAGTADPMPLKTMFDKQLTMKMGQCNVHDWIDTLLPIVENPDDPLGVEDLVTHHVGLDEAPGMYDTFRDKEDGCIKVVITP